MFFPQTISDNGMNDVEYGLWLIYNQQRDYWSCVGKNGSITSSHFNLKQCYYIWEATYYCSLSVWYVTFISIDIDLNSSDWTIVNENNPYVYRRITTSASAPSVPAFEPEC
jgi:hypothetical protein